MKTVPSLLAVVLLVIAILTSTNAASAAVIPLERYSQIDLGGPNLAYDFETGNYLTYSLLEQFDRRLQDISEDPMVEGMVYQTSGFTTNGIEVTGFRFETALAGRVIGNPPFVEVSTYSNVDAYFYVDTPSLLTLNVAFDQLPSGSLDFVSYERDGTYIGFAKETIFDAHRGDLLQMTVLLDPDLAYGFRLGEALQTFYFEGVSYFSNALTGQLSIVPVPEPSALTLVIGTLAIAILRRRGSVGNRRRD